MRCRPQAGHLSGWRRSIRLNRAASHVIARPIPVVMIRTPRRCGSLGIGRVSGWTARMWVRTEIGVTTACVRNMGVDLGRAQIRVTQHLLDRAEVGAPFEEMGGKRMAEQVRMHARRIESGLCGQPAKDEKRAGPGQSTPLRVEEKLRAMPAVQERPSSREVAAHGLDSFASKR